MPKRYNLQRLNLSGHGSFTHNAHGDVLMFTQAAITAQAGKKPVHLRYNLQRYNLSGYGVFTHHAEGTLLMFQQGEIRHYAGIKGVPFRYNLQRLNVSGHGDFAHDVEGSVLMFTKAELSGQPVQKPGPVRYNLQRYNLSATVPEDVELTDFIHTVEGFVDADIGVTLFAPLTFEHMAEGAFFDNIKIHPTVDLIMMHEVNGVLTAYVVSRPLVEFAYTHEVTGNLESAITPGEGGSVEPSNPTGHKHREQALWEWVSRPPRHGDSILFDYLRGVEGACAIAPVKDEVQRRYINSVAVWQYTFALQIMLPLSDVDDNNNIHNMLLARVWQHWVNEQARQGNFPDFGNCCHSYRLRSDTAPALTQMYDNNLAKYDFYATITYTEECADGAGNKYNYP